MPRKKHTPRVAGHEIEPPYVEWDRTLRPYLSACRAAYLNSVALKNDATLLFKHRRYPRAAALAVTGLEEAGKSLALFFLGIGHVLPSYRETLLKALRSKHRIKQATVFPLNLVGRLMPLLRRVDFAKIPVPRRKPRNWDELERFLMHSAPAILEVSQTLVTEIVDDVAGIEEQVGRRLSGDLESRRQRALYTDLRGADVQSPSSVSRQEASELLKELRFCLAALRFQADVARMDDRGVRAVLAAGALHRRLWAPDPQADSSDPRDDRGAGGGIGGHALEHRSVGLHRPSGRRSREAPDGTPL